jgi:hypothetical protein
MTGRVVCSECRTPLPDAVAAASDRPPCPICGNRTVTVFVEASMSVSTISDAVLGLELAPADGSRDWRRRWAEAQRHLVDLTARCADQLTAEHVHAARHELHGFFVHTYHLKDALIAENAVPAGQVETTITTIPALALLADLANLDKHGNLTRPPRSGDVPQIGDPRGVADGRAPGWTLYLPILHRSATLDGLQVARDAVEAWERALQGWGLI